MVKRISNLCALVGLVLFPAEVFGQIYACNLTSDTHQGGIPPVLVIEVDDAEKTVRVVDAVMLLEEQPPLVAKINKPKGDELAFEWRYMYKGTENRQTKATFDVRYVASFSKDRQKISLRGFPSGYDNRYRGKGTCTELNKLPSRSNKNG